MMKNLLTIALALVTTISFAQTFVSTTPENKNVVLEEFTGIYCGFCPDGHVIGQGLHDANPNDVFLINIHTGGYSNPNGPSDPDFNCLYGAAIGSASGLAGYPAGTVNRATFNGIAPQGSPGTQVFTRRIIILENWRDLLMLFLIAMVKASQLGLAGHIKWNQAMQGLVTQTIITTTEYPENMLRVIL